MRFIENCTDADLVIELIRRARQSDRLLTAPDRTTRHTPHSEVLIGIGADHTAHLTIDDDALEALVRKLNERRERES